jgi:hypothetical protein
VSAQLDRFGATPSADGGLVGLAIRLPEQCSRCSGRDAVIGAGRGPHKAAIMCVCGRHLGRMSMLTFNFIAETIRQFGRPSEPICVSRQRATADLKSPITPELKDS